MIENATVPSPKLTQFQQSLFDPSSPTNITVIAANPARAIWSSPLGFKGELEGGSCAEIEDTHHNILN